MGSTLCVGGGIWLLVVGGHTEYKTRQLNFMGLSLSPLINQSVGEGIVPRAM